MDVESRQPNFQIVRARFIDAIEQGKMNEAMARDISWLLDELQKAYTEIVRLA